VTGPPPPTGNASIPFPPAAPPPPLDTALDSSLNQSDGAAEISHIEAGAEDLATGVSLWDRAYDALANEDRNGIAAYEDLLSRVLIRGKPYANLYQH